MIKVFVINLERSPDRREFMRAQLDAVGAPHEFFRAVDASKGELASISRYDERLALWKLGHPLAPAEVGCFASHYKLWQHCVELGEPIVVMEDDVGVQPGFETALALAAREIAQRRFIRLLGLSPRPYRPVADLGQGHQLIRYLKGPFGTQCYALSPEGAQALLKHSSVWIDAVDMVIDAYWTHGLACYAITPFHLTHDQDDTPRSLIGDQRFKLKRSWHRSLRRKITRLGDRLGRIAFNLRYR